MGAAVFRWDPRSLVIRMKVPPILNKITKILTTSSQRTGRIILFSNSSKIISSSAFCIWMLICSLDTVPKVKPKIWNKKFCFRHSLVFSQYINILNHNYTQKNVKTFLELVGRMVPKSNHYSISSHQLLRLYHLKVYYV